MSRPPKDLQDKWYKILKDSGFEDIEDSNHNIKEWSRKLFQEKGKYHESLTKQSAKQDYYRLAGHFLYDYQGFTDTSRDMWKLHSEGISIRDISDIIKHRTGKTRGLSRNMVYLTINQLSIEMTRMYKVSI